MDDIKEANRILKREVYLYRALLIIFKIEHLSSFELFLDYLQISRVTNNEVYDKLEENAPSDIKQTIKTSSPK